MLAIDRLSTSNNAHLCAESTLVAACPFKVETDYTAALLFECVVLLDEHH
jgi:hypothetical protein